METSLTAEECVQHHPRNALEAWSQVITFDPQAPGSKYIDEWRSANAYMGLKRGIPATGTVIRDPTVLQPNSIREQYTLDRLVEMVPDEKSAHDQACVSVYDDHMTKEQRNERNTRCPSKLGECTSVNEKGEFESANSIAKRAYSKERKAKVVRGFCLNGLRTRKANGGNRIHFTEEEQLLQDRIQHLEDELAKCQAQPQRKENGCNKTQK